MSQASLGRFGQPVKMLPSMTSYATAFLKQTRCCPKVPGIKPHLGIPHLHMAQMPPNKWGPAGPTIILVIVSKKADVTDLGAASHPDLVSLCLQRVAAQPCNCSSGSSHVSLESIARAHNLTLQGVQKARAEISSCALAQKSVAFQATEGLWFGGLGSWTPDSCLFTWCLFLFSGYVLSCVAPVIERCAQDKN